MMRYLITGLFLIFLSGCDDNEEKIIDATLEEGEFLSIENDTIDLSMQYAYNSQSSSTSALINYDEKARPVTELKAVNKIVKEELRKLGCHMNQQVVVNLLIDEKGYVEKPSLFKGKIDEDCQDKLFEIIAEVRFEPGKHAGIARKARSMLFFEL